MSMFVLFNRNTLTPIQFSYDDELMYEAVEVMDGFFEGVYDVLDIDAYTGILSYQSELLKGVYNE
ncbi:hypothetical protein PM16_14 [Proteus phage PM16]|uniref:Uncharacterized protein n=1 Tax=Proteus phage PM16 TaxID=1357704 RepID=A0A0A6ZK83_9CAUD|nr:hypothetical protein ACQ55_gp14 [Proteus phage PM16]AGZ17259.1 hypothetical protein PM16_14 [Proteus phage PM16]